MVPEGWGLVPLSDLVREVRDRLDPESHPDLPYVGLADIEPEQRHLSLNGTLAEVASTKTRFIAGDTLFGKLRPYLHKVAQADFTGAASTDILVLRAKSALDPDFLYWRLTSPAVVRFATRHSAGTKMPRTSWSRLGEFLAPLPPAAEQCKIAAILSSVDEAIAATRRVIEQTEQVKKGLLQTLMTRGIGHTRFKTTEIGEIPEGWEVVTLEMVASVERGKFTARPRNDPRYYGGHIPFVQTGDVANADLVIDRHSQTLNPEGLRVSRLFPARTILMTIAANIGEVAQAAYPVAFPDSVVGISPRTGVDDRWLLHALTLQKDYLNGVATRNTQKNINLQVLRPLLIALPAPKEQQMIAGRLDSCVAAVRASRANLTHLQAVKRGLLQDLLSGRVRVTSD